MDEIKIKKTRQIIKIPTKSKRIPLQLIPMIDAIVKEHKDNIKKQRQMLKPKPKLKKELLQELELLKSQLNLPCEKEKGEA